MIEDMCVIHLGNGEEKDLDHHIEERIIVKEVEIEKGIFVFICFFFNY